MVNTINTRYQDVTQTKRHAFKLQASDGTSSKLNFTDKFRDFSP